MNNNYQNSGYQPPPPNGYYTYQPPNYNNAYYPPKPPYSMAAESALSSMNTNLFLLVSIIFGWLCARSLFIAETGIGMTVLGIAFYVFFMPFILRRQKKIPLSAWLLLIPQIVILLSFSLYSGVGYTMLALLALFVTAMFQTTLMAGCTEEHPFSFELLCDVCSTYLAYPFMNIGRTFSAVFGSKKDKSKEGGITVSSKIFIGLLISIPVVLILIALLSSADEIFAMWMGKIIDALNISLGRIIIDVILTMLTMLYIMPLVVTLRSGYHQPREKKAYNRPMDAIIVTTVLFAASVVYLIFVGVQFSYLFPSGNNLPDGLSYADYCRRGFFELVLVIAITTIVIALTCMLTKLNASGKLPIYTKVALLLITVSDFVMMISAAKRVYIYVNRYNMTVLRLNASVLIAFMCICLLAIAFKIVFEKLHISAVIGGVAVLMLALYCIADIDGFVAKYNVDKYLANPESTEIDVNYLSDDLSVAAVPQLERLMENSQDELIQKKAQAAIFDSCMYADLFDGDNAHLGRWSLDRQRAMNILQKYNMKYSDFDYYHAYENDYDDDYSYEDYEDYYEYY